MRNTFVALDDLRGLAALLVLTRHTTDYWSSPLQRSYLAVDVFFLLSGFVIAHRYEDRLASGQMSTRDFLVTRLIRLYPMYVISLLFVFSVQGLPAAVPLLQGVLMLPTVGERSMFPLNGVYWSLFFELVVNLLYVVARPLLTTRVLTSTVVFSGILLIALEREAGSLDIGWSGAWFDFGAGFARAAFGIFFGMLLYRHRSRIWSSLPATFGPFTAMSVVGVVLCTSTTAGLSEWIIDAVAAVFVLPLCVVSAARTTPAFGVKVMSLLGVTSYPAYLLHPTIGILGLQLAPAFIKAHTPWSGFAVALIVLTVSLAVERLVDLPLRRTLTQRFIRGGSAPAGIAIDRSQ